MEKTIAKLCQYLIDKQIIAAEDQEVYQYCFEVMVMRVLHTVLYLLIMWHYQSFLLPLIYLGTYMVLRSYIGGAHAPNMWLCLFSGLLLFILVINILLYAGFPAQGKLLFCLFSMTLSIWAMRHFGMQDHANRPLTKEEKAAAEKKFFQLFWFSVVVILIAVSLQQINIAFSIALAYFMATIFLLYAKLFYKEGTMSYEKP